MNDTSAVNETSSRRNVKNIVLWVVQGAVAVDFTVGGVLKLGGNGTMVNLFDRIGGGEWLRYLVGFVELAGGIGVLIPMLAGVAAIGLMTLLVSAAFTNVVIIDDPPWVPLIWLVIVTVVAWGRWPRTRALFTGVRRS